MRMFFCPLFYQFRYYFDGFLGQMAHHRSTDIRKKAFHNAVVFLIAAKFLAQDWRGKHMLCVLLAKFRLN